MWNPSTVIPSLTNPIRLEFSTEEWKAYVDAHGENAAGLRMVVLAWTTLIADTPLGDVKPRCKIRRFFRELVRDTLGFMEKLSSLAQRFVRSERLVGDLLVRDYITDMQALPIYREYHTWLETGDPALFKFILTFLNYGQKFAYEDKGLEASALNDWLLIEDKLGALELPTYVDDIASVMQVMLGDIGEHEVLPSHGPGAVAERGITGVDQKNLRCLGMFAKLEYTYFRKWTTGEAWGNELYPPHVTGDLTWENLKSSECVARLLFVPKKFNKLRSICAEPAQMQRFQQSVRLWCERIISQSKWLRNHVNLRDQTLNQRGAQRASARRRSATVDLRSASDSVAVATVRRVFRKVSALLRHLLATRSSMVTVPGGAVHKVHKFSPMGSSTCFPVQTMVYSAVIWYCQVCYMMGYEIGDPRFSLLDLEMVMEDVENLRGPYSGGAGLEPFCVFGDDLVVDEAILSSVVRVLSDLGFQVNSDKTFSGDYTYRESCGKHYVRGFDVSYLTWKFGPVGRLLDLKQITGLVDHINLVGEAGYEHLRRFLIRLALYHPVEGMEWSRPEFSRPRELRRNPILFCCWDSDESFAIKCDVPRNSHLEKQVRFFTAASVPMAERWIPPVPATGICRSLHRPSINWAEFEDWRKMQGDNDFQYEVVATSAVIRTKTREVKDAFFDPYYHTVYWRARYGETESEAQGVSSLRTEARGVVMGRRTQACS